MSHSYYSKYYKRSRIYYGNIRPEARFPIYTIAWHIPEFSKLVNKNSNEEFLSDKCFSEDGRKYKHFELKICFCNHNNHFIEFYFLSPTSVHVRSILTVWKRTHMNYNLNETYKPFDIKSNTKYQTAYANTWQYLTRLYKNDRDNKEANISEMTSHDGRLDLHFKFIIDNSVNLIGLPIGPIYEEDNNQFTKMYEDLFINGLYSDIVMKSADNKEFKVHKAVLASRSAVLKAHFEHNTIECQTNIVGSSFDSDVLKEVLTFIYSDKAPRVNVMPEKLLAAGDYYRLDKLKNLASQTLYEKLTVDNAVETLQLADMHSDSNLKKWTLIYIKNSLSSVQRTDGWAKLNSAELVKTLCEYIANTDVETQ